VHRGTPARVLRPREGSGREEQPGGREARPTPVDEGRAGEEKDGVQGSPVRRSGAGEEARVSRVSLDDVLLDGRPGAGPQGRDRDAAAPEGGVGTRGGGTVPREHGDLREAPGEEP